MKSQRYEYSMTFCRLTPNLNRICEWNIRNKFFLKIVECKMVSNSAIEKSKKGKFNFLLLVSVLFFTCCGCIIYAFTLNNIFDYFNNNSTNETASLGLIFSSKGVLNSTSVQYNTYRDCFIRCSPKCRLKWVLPLIWAGFAALFSFTAACFCLFLFFAPSNLGLLWILHVLTALTNCLTIITYCIHVQKNVMLCDNTLRVADRDIMMLRIGWSFHIFLLSNIIITIICQLLLICKTEQHVKLRSIIMARRSKNSNNKKSKKKCLSSLKLKVESRHLKKLAKDKKLRKRDKLLRRTVHRQVAHGERMLQWMTLTNELRQARAEDENSEEEEDILPFDMLDPELANSKIPKYEEEETTANTTTTASTTDDEDDDDQLSIDHVPWSGYKDVDSKLKPLLPVKTLSGKVIKVAAVEETENSASSGEDDEMEVDSGDANVAGYSSAERPIAEDPLTCLARVRQNRRRVLEECKMKIASICPRVLENPQQHISQLNEIMKIASGRTYPLYFATTGKLAMASLLQVFLDIIPGYTIRPPTEKELRQKMKKETRQLWNFEQILLKLYVKYLKLLEKLVTKIKHGSNSAVLYRLGIFSLKLYSELLLKHPHFNYRNNIIFVLVPFMCSKDEVIRDLVCGTFKQLFSDDTRGAVSLDAVRAMNQFLRKKPHLAKPEMLRALLELKIKEVKRENSDEDGSTRKKIPSKSLSRQQRKYFGSVRRLEMELKEIDHTKIMEHLFNIYFRILRKNPEAVVLSPVLEGLSKFGHLINVDFFDGLFSTLQSILKTGKLPVIDALHCVYSVYQLLSNEGQALNVDPYYFQNCLYMLFRKIMNVKQRTLFIRQFELYLKCLDVIINKRRKEISKNRVAAYIKRMASAFHQMNEPELIASLLAIRSYFMSHPNLECMLDTEEQLANPYFSNVDDLEHCGAIACKLDELQELKNHPSALVRHLTMHILNNFPTTGRRALNVDLLQKSAVEIYQTLQTNRCKELQKRSFF
ncbi:Nucleolar complex protein 3 -like protein [Trichinella pseudospiralis]|uniref:NOC3-like protein n=1 Tax=Trichinella pseudospiralis TaxID=6337 RepID=A0A0V1KBF2_TRIPS|nr:Nucleolar complex protein 3 -like protein [Trichinella pseudospiralis]